MLRSHLFVPSKREYVRGKRPRVNCILCEVNAGRDTVDRLQVFRSGLFVVSLNLHPYNPGHVMIFPQRHLEDPRQMTRAEALELHELQRLTFDVLDRRYQPSGYNVGYNCGDASGASIRHFHLHVVPRYHRELGFMDVLGGAKIFIEDPVAAMTELRDLFEELAGKAEKLSG